MTNLRAALERGLDGLCSADVGTKAVQQAKEQELRDKHDARARQEIGRRIRVVRTHKKMKQARLAALAGCSEQTISNLEAGTRDCHFSNVVAIARALGVSLDDMVTPLEHVSSLIHANLWRKQ